MRDATARTAAVASWRSNADVVDLDDDLDGVGHPA
jgi:hypothetical protein